MVYIAKISKPGEYASASIHRKEKKLRTKPVKKIQQQDIEKLLEKHSLNYSVSKQELQEISKLEDIIDLDDYPELVLKNRIKKLHLFTRENSNNG